METTIAPALRPGLSTSSSKPLRFRGVFFDAAPSVFLGSLDQTIVAAALRAIAAGLGGFEEIAWIVTSYLLAAAVAAPIYGRLGDAFGRRTALISALAFLVSGFLVPHRQIGARRHAPVPRELSLC